MARSLRRMTGGMTQDTHYVTYATRIEAVTHTYATPGRYMATISLPPAAAELDQSGGRVGNTGRSRWQSLAQLRRRR